MVSYSELLGDHIEQYRKYCEASDLWTDHTERQIRYFDSYCKETSPEADELTQEMVDGWCKKRDTEKMSSCRSRIYPVVGFVNYLISRGYADVDPPAVPNKSGHTYIPHEFTDAELSAFFQKCDTIETRGNTNACKIYRLTIPVFFRLLYSSGIRTYEARFLKVSDVNLKTGVVDIQKAKGRIQHYIVLHDTLLPLMIRYNELVSFLSPEREYFFPGSRTAYLSGRWPTANFAKIWSTISTARAVPYDLRHNYAVENIDSWVDLGYEAFDKFVYLSKSMGHCNLESTRYYYHYTSRLDKAIKEKAEESISSMMSGINYEDFKS